VAKLPDRRSGRELDGGSAVSAAGTSSEWVGQASDTAPAHAMRAATQERRCPVVAIASSVVAC
jgi:hypothetical protein